MPLSVRDRAGQHPGLRAGRDQYDIGTGSRWPTATTVRGPASRRAGDDLDPLGRQPRATSADCARASALTLEYSRGASTVGRGPARPSRPR